MVRPSAALARVGAVAALMVGLAVLTRRPDLVAVAAPFALAATVGRPPRTGLTAELSLASTRVEEGEEVLVVVRVAAGVALEAVRVELEPGSLEGAPLARVVAMEGTEVEVAFRLRAGRWGRTRVGPAVVTGYGAVDGYREAPVTTASVALRVVPAVGVLEAGEVATRALRLVGEHRASAPGAGLELLGVRPYRAGDRLRRVNWRATALRDELHVTTTRREQSALVVLVPDTAYDAGRPGASALDETVRATAALAGHFLGRGDAVGLVDTSEVPRRLPPRSGRRQLDAIGDYLLDARTRRESAPWTESAWVEHAVPSGAFVVVLTPLLDVRSVELLVELRAAGRLALALDTLPAGVAPLTSDAAEAAASALYFLEREAYVARLVELGVPVARLADAGSLGQALLGLARVAQAPRIAR